LGRKSRAKKLESSKRITEGPRPAEGGARRFWLLIGAAAVVVCVVAAVPVAFFMLRGGSADEGPLKAAIVDQLSSREANQSFVDSAATLLANAGYDVEYYPGESVDVDAYRALATHDYKVIVLRAHSAVPRKDLSLPPDVDQAVLDQIMNKIGDDVLLFTSEPYDGNAYIDDQKGLRLFPVVYAGDDMSQTYFAISAGFIESNMGHFDGTTIILMGCSSMATDKTAAAFVDKGASAVIGWSDLVTPEHTDEATERVLQYLLKDHLTPSQAVDKANADLGPDPEYGAVMKAYPSGN
jgi:hypothetical protein